MMPGQRLVENYDARRIGRIRVREIAARAQLDAHRFKVIRTADSESNLDAVTGRRQRTAFNRQRLSPPITREREMIDRLADSTPGNA
jgi:hypothetical protein